MEHYLNSKRRLFSDHLHAESLSILSDQHPAIMNTTIDLGRVLQIYNGANDRAQAEPGWTFALTEEAPRAQHLIYPQVPPKRTRSGCH